MTLTCVWCGREFERPKTMGRPPAYCSAGHRQRAYETRRALRLFKELEERWSCRFCTRGNVVDCDVCGRRSVVSDPTSEPT